MRLAPPASRRRAISGCLTIARHTGYAGLATLTTLRCADISPVATSMSIERVVPARIDHPGLTETEHLAGGEQGTTRGNR